MNDFNISKRLLELRKEKGLTQKELSEQINYSDKVISKWECGESLPSILVLKELSEFYEVSIDSIVGKHKKQTLSKDKKMEVTRTVRPSFIIKYFIIIPTIGQIATIRFGPGVFSLSMILYLVFIIIWAILMSKAEWETEYNGHKIKVINNISKLELLIDDSLVDGYYGIFGLHVNLRAAIDNNLINVKVGNSLRLICVIFVD